MVERVDHLLRTQLNQPLGLASPAVRILDPCCGTGAYLTAVLHRIHRTLLENAGDDTALVPSSLRTAALRRSSRWAHCCSAADATQRPPKSAGKRWRLSPRMRKRPGCWLSAPRRRVSRRRAGEGGTLPRGESVAGRTDRDFAAFAAGHQSVGVGGLVEREAVGDDLLGV